MTKDQFIRSYAEEKGITIKEAKEQVNGVFGHVLTVVPQLEDGEKLDITGIVQFKVKDVPARTVRNPQNGEPMEKGETRKVTVSAKATLKNAVKE